MAIGNWLLMFAQKLKIAKNEYENMNDNSTLNIDKFCTRQLHLFQGYSAGRFGVEEVIVTRVAFIEC